MNGAIKATQGATEPTPTPPELLRLISIKGNQADNCAVGSFTIPGAVCPHLVDLLSDPDCQARFARWLASQFVRWEPAIIEAYREIEMTDYIRKECGHMEGFRRISRMEMERSRLN